MARMHTGKHGKSKSRKPEVEMGKMPDGIELSKKEIKEKIAEYARQGVSPSQIGQYLKEKDGIPYIRQALGARLLSIMDEMEVSPSLPPDLTDLIRKALKLRKHLEKNKQDVHNRIRLGRTEAKIWRLTKYYKREGSLPADWKYDPAKAALTIKV